MTILMGSCVSSNCLARENIQNHSISMLMAVKGDLDEEVVPRYQQESRTVSPYLQTAVSQVADDKTIC